MPPWASGPVFTVSRPSLNGVAWAIAGAGNWVSAAAAPAAVPANSVRRVILSDLRDIKVLPLALGRSPRRQSLITIHRSVPPQRLSSHHPTCRFVRKDRYCRGLRYYECLFSLCRDYG